MADSPAEAAGFRQGDVITSFAGTAVKDYRHLQRLVAEAPANKPLVATVVRDGREMRLSVVLVSTDSPQALNAAPRHADADWIGMDVAELPPRLKQRGLNGVVVTGLDPDGMAADAGIEKGDILVAINRTVVPDVAAYRRALQAAERAGNLTILVRRGGSSIYFALRPGGRR
jgi:S1-C subfamily serine protease